MARIISVIISLVCVSVVLGARTVAHAQSWSKVFDCVGSNAVIDRETLSSPASGFEDFQIVFRDQNMIGQLLQSGAVDIKRLTSLNEVVLLIRQNEMNPREWIGENDAFAASGVVHFIKPQESTITFETYRTTQSAPSGYIVLDKIGTWELKDCRLQVPARLN